MEAPLFLKSDHLTTHGVIVGMTGSGKTGLGVILLEEVLLSGIPTLILDPKGDMGNLLLTFPRLSADAFLPWITETEASSEGVSPLELAEQKASFWKKGLASWGIAEDRIGRLREHVDFGLYTPGSQAGIPLNIVGTLKAPASRDDIETLRDEIEGFVSSLLTLIDIEADPISSREHILLSNLIEHAWQHGNDLDLAQLVGQVQQPPLRKLGVIEIDSFFPQKDRRELALKINGLLASPSFGAWMEGPPLDMNSLLYTESGSPRAAILSLAHLSDDERQFVVTLVLSRLVTWMRGQPGSEDLRVMIYMDEVFGFVPPSKTPPSKKPILTILKQARAFGVGMVLSTQNPVDIDYKALSNTGAWMIGRLQTERDKARLMDGLSSAGGDTDIRAIDRMISGLQKRQFMYHSTRTPAPALFTTRWAMSYLKGPLTRDEIGRLTQSAPERSYTPDASTPAEKAGPASSTVAPTAAPDVPVYYLHPAARWPAVKDINPNSSHYRAALATRVQLTYDDVKAKLQHQEEWEAVLFPLPEQVDAGEAISVDYDERDFLTQPAEGATFEIPEADLHAPSFFKNATQDIKQHLYRNQSVTVYRNTSLKLYSRIGESRAAFAERCRAASEKLEDQEAAQLRDSFESRIKRTRDMLERAEDRLEELEVDHSARKTDEILSGVGTLVSLFMSGKKSSRKLATELRRASSKRKQTRTTSRKLESAENRVEEKMDQLEDLEHELADRLLGLDEEWSGKAEQIEEIVVGLEKTDIHVEEVSLVWIPV